MIPSRTIEASKKRREQNVASVGGSGSTCRSVRATSRRRVGPARSGPIVIEHAR
jgi:hypothetical protein